MENHKAGLREINPFLIVHRRPWKKKKPIKSPTKKERRRVISSFMSILIAFAFSGDPIPCIPTSHKKAYEEKHERP